MDMTKLNGETMSHQTGQKTLQTGCSEGLSTVGTEQNASQQSYNLDSEYNMIKSYTRIPFKLWKHPASLDQIKLKGSIEHAHKKVPKPKNSKNDKDKNAIKSPQHSSDDKLLPAVNVHKISKIVPTFNAYKLQLARERTENAIKLNQIFTIQGGYSTVRYCLRQRGWVENYFQMTKICKQPQVKTIPLDGIQDATEDDADNDIDENDNDISNVKWREEDRLYNIMSRMVRNVQPSLIWVLQRDYVDHQLLNKDQMINHFLQSGVFTTKVGLCLNLRNLPWYDETDPHTFFPRCYLLCHSEEKQEFIDDFNLTACTSILKIVLEAYYSTSRRYNKGYNEEIRKIIAADRSGETENLNFGEESEKKDEKKTKREILRLPADIVEQAVRYCDLFLGSKDNQDLDSRVEKSLNEAELADLRHWHYHVIHSDLAIEGVTSALANLCESTLKRLRLQCPQLYLDGKHNIWILKPGAQSRGRGISCHDDLDSILKVDEGNVIKKESKYVIQKYIERPLLIYNCKFDIRQWFLVTDWNPLTVWFYKDCYLRFCSQQFTLNDFNASIHLCNNVIQRNYKNGPRAKELPENNMWTHHQFKNYLRMQSSTDLWEESIYPKIKKAIICSVIVSQELVETRKGSFELYGADFMLSDDYIPWLIEINSNPSMQHSTKVTSVLCCKVLEDTLKVVLDRKYNKCCDTGSFELGYKQSVISCPLYLCLNMSIEGQRMKTPTSVGKQILKSPVRSPLRSSSVNSKHKKGNESMPKDTDRISGSLKYRKNSKTVNSNCHFLNDMNTVININRSKICKPKACFGKFRTIRPKEENGDQSLLVSTSIGERQFKTRNSKNILLTQRSRRSPEIKSFKQQNHKLSLTEYRSSKEAFKAHKQAENLPKVLENKRHNSRKLGGGL
ncbi:tubulin monoglycylase TTLL3 isoform X1 [Octopus bimaculoides]|uniref:tubulin monoglycylase TTLL3 isoform X1 n=2 Tax=Octopus bimaculoides TaxID=37653 RepID=UPI0022DF1711|nr:tubulin monoglycylase TTLL3 isoform X1 [Octopus bimaculoides]